MCVQVDEESRMKATMFGDEVVSEYSQPAAGTRHFNLQLHFKLHFLHIPRPTTPSFSCLCHVW